jgi:hypothetical protein
VSYACITESIACLEKFNVEQAKKLKEMCESFSRISDESQVQIEAMLSQLKEVLTPAIAYFKVNSYKDDD